MGGTLKHEFWMPCDIETLVIGPFSPPIFYLCAWQTGKVTVHFEKPNTSVGYIKRVLFKKQKVRTVFHCIKP